MTFDLDHIEDLLQRRIAQVVTRQAARRSPSTAVVSSLPANVQPRVDGAGAQGGEGGALP